MWSCLLICHLPTIMFTILPLATRIYSALKWDCNQPSCARKEICVAATVSACAHALRQCPTRANARHVRAKRALSVTAQLLLLDAWEPTLCAMIMICAQWISAMPQVDASTLPLRAMTETHVPWTRVKSQWGVFTLRKIAMTTMCAPPTHVTQMGHASMKTRLCVMTTMHALWTHATDSWDAVTSPLSATMETAAQMTLATLLQAVCILISHLVAQIQAFAPLTCVIHSLVAFTQLSRVTTVMLAQWIRVRR